MKKLIRLPIALLVLLSSTLLLTACFHDDDDDHEHSETATIIPAVNPKFDSITSIAKSDDPNGTYTALAATDFAYEVDKELITLGESQVGANGTYFQIVGKATVGHHGSKTYTVYTYLADADADVAANELTTLAVAAVANDSSIATYHAAITALAAETGIDADEITKAQTEETRAGNANLVATLAALAESVEGDADTVNLTTLADTAAPNMDQIAWGALLYDNWMKSPTSAPVQGSAPAPVLDHTGHQKAKQTLYAGSHDGHAGGKYGHDKKPALLVAKVGDETTSKHLVDGDGEEHEGFRRFARCKECHGWDQKGDQGSFANRGRGTATLTDADDTNTETNTGAFVRRPKAIAGTDLSSTTASMMNMVAMTDASTSSNTRKYGNITTAALATTAAATAIEWNDQVNAQETVDNVTARLSDKHPSFTRLAASDADGATDPFGGADNDIVPTHMQIMALIAFLNFEGADMDSVMTWTAASGDTAGSYAIDEHGSAAAGEHIYATNCFRCHGAPDTSLANPLHHDYTNLIGFVADSNDATGLNQVRLSALAHVARWGKAGKVMTRDRIGSPTASDVASVLTYVKAYNDELVAIAADSSTTPVYTSGATATGTTGVGDAAKGKTLYDKECAYCHAAHDGDGTDETDEDTTARCHKHSDDSTYASETDGSCPGSTHDALLPNLAPHKMNGHTMIHHFAMRKEINLLTGVDDDGKANGLMKGKEDLTQQQINDLTAYLNSVGDLTVMDMGM